MTDTVTPDDRTPVDKTELYREMYKAVAEQYAALLAYYDLAEDAQATDIIEAATRETPPTPSADAAWVALRDDIASVAYELTRRPNGPSELRGEIDGIIARHRPLIEAALARPAPALDVDALYLAEAAKHLLDHLASERPAFYCEDADNVRHFSERILAAALETRE